MHGDLYAHNILHGGQGQALMGDFGAASFYATGDQALANALQRLEVRAFGCLLEELLDRCDAQGSAQRSLAVLASLKNDCLDEQAGDRPLFGEIVITLAALRDSRRDEATSA